MVGKGFELFSFEFSLPQSCVACPNCGYQVCNTILQKVSLSKTFVLLCCGSVIYWNYFKDNELISLFSSAKEIIQNGFLNIFSSSRPIHGTSPVNQSNINILNHYYQCSSNTIRNQLVINNNNNNNNNCYEEQTDSNDFSSLNLSPLNSIGVGTLAKLDNMLDEVAEIKMYVNDSCNELQLFNATDTINLGRLNDRRVSDGELTLPSLEWDLNDVNFYGDNYDQVETEQNSNDINEYNNYIDSETLSQIIFNKDFEFKDERFFRMKKQYLNLKQRLKLMSKTQARQRNNLNSDNYRMNRDSAFFEEIQ